MTMNDPGWLGWTLMFLGAVGGLKVIARPRETRKELEDEF